MPADAVARWIRRELAARPPRARSLVVTVWGDTLAPHGGEVWLATLIRLLAPFGVNERLVRTSVFRLAKDGWLESRARGRRTRYRLTATGAQRFAQAYRRVYTPPARPWDGTWDVVVLGDAVPPAERPRLRDDLAWSGHAPFAPGLYARPASSADAARDSPAAWPAGVLRFIARDLPAGNGASLASRVDEAWSLPQLAVGYRGFAARFRPLATAFADDGGGMTPEQAFVVRTLLVHEYRRVRLRDPQLPPELLPPEWPGMAAYDLGRELYRAAEPLARAHLEAALRDEGEALLPALPEFLTRFGPL